MTSFYKAKGQMESLLTGDIAMESLEIAEDEYLMSNQTDNSRWDRQPAIRSRDVPPGEDIKWMCGDCGATDWTPINRRCDCCRD